MNCRFKTLLFAAAFVVAAGCNNAGKDAGSTTAVAPAAAPSLPSDSASRAAAYNFIEACVESSKASRPDEAKAFAYCKCMEAQIRQKYGNTDSLSVAALQQDTVTLKAFLSRCP